MSAGDPTLLSGPPRSISDPVALRSYLKTYYGRRLQRTEDLERKACCADSTASRYSEIVEAIPEEVRQRNYGCGCPIPEDDLRGLAVLDLGCGAGLDCFILSCLVGPEGQVHGIDMTEEQLAVARRNAPLVARNFGYERSNVHFHQGFIETADAIPDASIDLVVSDCTINLSPLKEAVFRTIHRVLKPGGEFYISDIVADRRVPGALRADPTLVAECLGGALYEHDLFDLLEDAGFRDARVVSRALVEEDVDGHPIRFYSLTFRGFRLTPPLDRRCEDYGQTAVYRGTIRGLEARYRLDDHHVFERGRPAAVCRNTARILSETRLGRHFDVSPEREHFGLFRCGTETAPGTPPPAGGLCC